MCSFHMGIAVKDHVLFHMGIARSTWSPSRPPSCRERLTPGQARYPSFDPQTYWIVQDAVYGSVNYTIPSQATNTRSKLGVAGLLF